MDKRFAIIEIGSNNTKTHIYEDDKIVFDNNVTIEFKKNYAIDKRIKKEDLEKLFSIIDKAFTYTKNIHIFGCSIFRKITSEELNDINQQLEDKYNLKVEVVSQEDEALYTALGCYSNIQYDGNICVFIGGGGSTELIFVNNKNVIEKKYYNFGVVDVTNKYPSLKDNIAACSFDEVYNYVASLIDDINIKADILILAGGDHLYWYNNARYELFANTLYEEKDQKYIIPIAKSDEYDQDALVTSLDTIRNNSDNPLWFDGSRAMKVITNLISHKIDAKYIVPTRINMEKGLKNKIQQKR